jgi:DNA-binding CsgD family transcriptional regulator
VVFRWALGRRCGERPTPEVATLVVDLKRTYLQLRATLRRVYTVVADWPAAAPVLRVMGFDALEEVAVGDRRFALGVPRLRPRRCRRVDRSPRARRASRSAPSRLPRGGQADRDGGLGGVPVGRPQPDPGAAVRPPLLRLTAREQEVLALLAEGMTNAQLAEVLFISERTANRHVSNIFTKLGVHNRTQAARAAVAAGLAG